MAYIHVYSTRINWENEPSITSPINATNLNKMDYALKAMDDTFGSWDITKANESDLLLALKDVSYDTDTGVFVFTWFNGTTSTIDLNIEKIPVSFSMDANGVITMTTEDGTTYTADVGALIKTYTFADSSVIDFTVTTDASGNKTVTADIVNGSIDGTKLTPNYLADCTQAKTGAENAANAADDSAEDAEAWAVGTRGGVPVPSTDPAYENNAEYWAHHTSAKVNYTDNAVLGAKNLFLNNATSQTEHGVTFTVNSDGSINVSGTASGGNGFVVLGTIELKQGVQYILSGGVSGNLRIDLRNSDLSMWTNNTASQEVHSPKGSFIDTFTPNATSVVNVCVRAQSGSTVSGTLYPMIRLATDTDDTFAPYAKTNRELTESLKVVGNVLTVATSNDIEWKYADARANDTVVGFKGFVQLKRDATASENTWITIGTISKTPTWWSQNVSTKLAGTGTAGDSTYQITASGEVQFNIRAGMKTGDQYLIAGTNIL